MTRRGRLSRLEARRKEEAGDVVGIFEADPVAGVWREVNAPTGRVRVLPLSPEELREAEGQAAAGGGLLFLAPVCHSKVIPGVTWGDL